MAEYIEKKESLGNDPKAFMVGDQGLECDTI